ncbi:MAG: hypothetical protein JWM96_255 [Alphaproteobacteria bacterium]|nr:hypothetical protein [Alphaproteobacteria bacterium]
MTRFVTKADFDFSKGAEYRKAKLLSKSHIRMAEKEEKIISFHSTGKETQNTAMPGDYIIKTTEKGDGYIITADRFFEIYEDDAGDARYYRNKITRIALLILEDIRFIAPWGEEQNVASGGVIVDAGNYIYGIEKNSFITNYARVDNNEAKEIFALVKDDLEEQLEKAVALKLENHILDIKTRLENKLFHDASSLHSKES